MKTIYTALFVLLFLSCEESNQYQRKTNTEEGYTYEYVSNDPMNTRIYTLENGLKVYLSDYENAPRAHVYIPVKAGGKNDPASNTGLAHYLEHMMFKGTADFGTLDYEAEKILLDSIENMFNFYSTIKDETERKEYYKKIDAVSNKAAELAIPNEYDKMISTIGGKGLNAYTTEDRTVYTVDIPSNELSRFLAIEGNRFKKIVNRLFHTELEAVYEEKNRSLDNDLWKSVEALYEATFEKHQYGTQTVIGTIDHLKNPSITEIKSYFDEYYRPNNVAICISGDIEYSETIKLIDSFFGDWKPNDNLAEWTKIEEAPITAPRVREVYGPDAESLRMAYRFDGRGTQEHHMIRLVDMILSNAEAGLIDINLKQKQKVLNAGCSPDVMNDYTLHTFFGSPKQGQTLEEVRDLLLAQIELVKKGEFEDWLIPAVIADFKKSEMKKLESNRSRANEMVMAFTNDIPWETYIQNLDVLETITKKQIVDFVNINYTDNYAIVFKRSGEDSIKQQVDKPMITKVPVNREQKSDFHAAIAQTEVQKLKPVFVDYETEITQFDYRGLEVLSRQNTENKLFELTYMLEAGSFENPVLKMAVGYLEYIGTENLSSEDFKKELYKLGCSFSVNASGRRTYVTLSGLDENMEKATVLFEQLIRTPKPDQKALDDLVDRVLKSRADAKKSKQTILWSGLVNYARYGAKNPFTNNLANYELLDLTAEKLTAVISEIPLMKHRVLYYGPKSKGELETFLTTYHAVPEEFKPLPANVVFEQLKTPEPKVYWADYDMVQSEMVLLHTSIDYDPKLSPEIKLFNEYFGGGMNSIVFQEIREAQGLAYSVFSQYSEGDTEDKANSLFAYIGTQADKQSEAMKAMVALLNDLPESENAFSIAKQGILNKIESERITKSGIIWNYINAQDNGLTYDIRQDVYADVKEMTFENLTDFHEKYVKNKNYVTVIVGSKDKIDFNDLKNYGTIQELSLDELFGYEDIENIKLN
ncbi:MAG: zinc protease [Cyclobacteriaceae bacterium]|jgi:zinc protease